MLKFVCFAFEQNENVKIQLAISKPAHFHVSINICLIFELTQASWLEIKIFSYKNKYFGLEIKKENVNSRSKPSCVHCGPESVLCIISGVLVLEICITAK